MKYVISDKKLMPHITKKADKIMAVALGWALTEITLYKVVRLSATQFNEESVRVEIFVDALSSLLDFIRVIGIAFLVEKLTRRSWKPYNTYLYGVLAVVLLLSEYCSTEMERLQRKISELHQDSLFDNDRNQNLISSPEFKSIIVTGFIVKGAGALLSLAANQASPL